MANESKKFNVTFRPKGTRARFNNSSFNTRAEAEARVRKILKKDNDERLMKNPRVSKNPFFKK